MLYYDIYLLILGFINNPKTFYNASLVNKEFSLICRLLSNQKKREFRRKFALSKDNQLIIFYLLPNNKIYGLFQRWYIAYHFLGDIYKLTSKSNIYEDKFEGLKENWYLTGKLSSRCMYHQDKLEGVYQGWDGNEKLHIECTYKNGKLEGLYQYWFGNGILHIKCSYQDGKLEGLYQEWNSNGSLYKQCNYHKGKVLGIVKIYA